MVDIHSATAEIRRGEKKEERKKERNRDKNIISASATQGGHNKYRCSSRHREVSLAPGPCCWL